MFPIWPLAIQDKDITADALLTQRKLADYLCLERKAHYHFTVKGNQPGLFRDIKLDGFVKSRHPGSRLSPGQGHRGPENL